MPRPAQLTALVVATLFAANAALHADEKTTYELPADGKTPVLELDYKGGFTPPRLKKDPALSILADGTVLMPDRFGMGKDVTGKVSKEELQELLRFVIAEKKFAEIDGKELKKEVAEAEKKRGGFIPRIADAPNTWVRVNVKGHQHEAEYYALGMAANQWPAVQGLQDLDAVSKRLQQVMNLVRGGGRERVEAMLKLANAELKKQHPDADPLTMEHFRYASENADGSRRYSFSWNAQGMPGVPATATYVSATVVVPAEGEAEVMVRTKL